MLPLVVDRKTRMNLSARVANSIKDHPWTVIVVCLLITLSLGFGLLFLKGHVTYQSLLPAEFPSVKALDSLQKEFGGISYEYVLVKAPDVTDNKITEFLVGLEDTLKKDPRFNSGQLQTRVDASGARVPIVQDYLTPFIANMQREMAKRGFNVPMSSINNDAVLMFTGKDFHGLVEQDYLSNAQASAQVVGRFVTPDRKAALIMMKAGPLLTERQQVKLGADIDAFFKSKLGTMSGVTLSIAGDATLARDFNTHINKTTALLFGIAMLLVLITLFIAFRRVSDTLLPIAVMLLALVCTFGLTGWLGIQYTVAVIAVMPLLLGHALTFVVPFIARYYEEVERYARPVESVGKALMAIGVALFLAAITNTFGFLVFGFSVLPALREFGLTCAIGNLFVFVLSATMLPAVIVVRERALEKRAGAKGDEETKYFDGLSLRKSQGVFTRATNRSLDAFAGVSVRYSMPVIIVFGVLILLGFTQIRGLKTDSDLRKLVPKNLPGMSANFELEKYFGGHQQDVVMVTGDVLAPGSLKAMAGMESAITGPEGEGLYTASGVTGLPDVLTAANNSTLPATREEAARALKTAEDNGGYVVGGLLSVDGKSALLTLNAGGAQSTAVVDRKIQLLNTMGQKYLHGAGLTFKLGGITPLTKDMTKNIIPTETLSATLSLALCALILIIIFRSFTFGLITLTVALAGVAAEIGFMSIVNWPLDFMTSLVSALVIGIGVNFGILFTHRYIQEMRQGDRSPAGAIGSTMANLGRANVIAALTTVAAFVIIMFSGIVPLRRFGGVTAVAITVCVITSLTLMPALFYRLSGKTEVEVEPALKEPEPEPQTT